MKNKRFEKGEKRRILKAIKTGLGKWTNQSLYASSGGGDFHFEGNIYRVSESFELIDSVVKL